MTSLDPSKLHIDNDLSVTNNAQLASLKLPEKMTTDWAFGTIIANLEIANNPMLSSSNITGPSGSWPWGIIQAARMTLQDHIFHTDLLQFAPPLGYCCLVPSCGHLPCIADARADQLFQYKPT